MKTTEEFKRVAINIKGGQMDRKSGIGGSECAAVLGLSKWKTAYQVYLDKICKDEESNKIENDAMRFGKYLEPIIVKEYQRVTGNDVDLCVDEKGDQITWVSKKYPWLRAHVDGLVVGKPLILEAKSTRFFSDGWGEIGTDRIPIDYLVQCAHYCIVMSEFRDVEGVDIAALGSTSDFRMYHYVRNGKIEKKIIEKTEQFWNGNVLANVPPNPTFQDDLAKIYKTCLHAVAVATDDIVLSRNELLGVRSQLKLLEEKEENLKKVIQMHMKENDTLVDVSGNILATWKNQISSRLDSKALKESGIDLTNYYSTTETRRFFIKEYK